MKQASFYHKETGAFASHTITASDEKAIALNTPVDHIAIEGRHDHMCRRFDIASGQIIDYQPPAPSTDHVWNPESKRWQLSAATLEKIAASTSARNRILELEASQHRLVREHIIGKPDALAKLQAIDDEIFALRPSIL